MTAQRVSSTIKDLKGMVALVTGGCSGLGKATVERLLRGGANVVVGDLPNGPTEPGSVMPSYKQLGNCEYSPLDVKSVELAERAVSMCKKKFDRLDILVNCAGFAQAFRTYNLNKKRSHELVDFMEMINVNAVGTYNMVRLAAALMCANEPDNNEQRGIIVNTSGLAAFDGQTAQAGFAAGCGAIASMTLPIARDLAEYGIRCVTVAPALINTPLINSLPEKIQTFFCKAIPSPARFGDPDEFAHLVESIIRNPYINGEVVRLDGGLRFMPG